MDELSDLAKQLGVVLQAQGKRLALAESCTGGMVAQVVTSVAGSSAWFDRGFVTYSNQAKAEMLGVSNATLDKYGAVSEQTASEMALGVIHNSNADISGSITGIAGPTGGSAEKPVGTVCFAWATKNMCLVNVTKHFQGDRQEVREQASKAMLEGLLNILMT
jgi:nicotinamide-nucleotide amidase